MTPSILGNHRIDQQLVSAASSVTSTASLFMGQNVIGLEWIYINSPITEVNSLYMVGRQVIGRQFCGWVRSPFFGIMTVWPSENHAGASSSPSRSSWKFPSRGGWRAVIFLIQNGGIWSQPEARQCGILEVAADIRSAVMTADSWAWMSSAHVPSRWIQA